MRDKWDRKTGDSTYGQITIRNAVLSASEIYRPVRTEDDAHGAEDDFRNLDVSTIQEERDRREREGYSFTPDLRCLDTTVEALAPHTNPRYESFQIGNARMFVDYYRNIILMNDTRNCWYIYDGRVWRPDNHSLRISEMAKDFHGVLLNFANSITSEDTRDRFLKRVDYLDQKKFRDIMVKDSSNDKSISVKMNAFDRDKYTFNCHNGTINLKTGEFRPHSPADRLTKMTEVDYDPEATCPRWLTFMDEVFEGDAERIRYLQKAVGYAMSGDTRLECMFTKVEHIDRKAVAEPYDMDTAIGTNNEGSLVFGFSLEDTDHLTGGANIFNGQNSVLWCNIRDAFSTEIRQMYQTLRSGRTLSYASVESRYEAHQSKWPVAVWIEDAWFKYIDPLINPDPGKEPTGVYLPMMQGSKEEQRKWWLSNRFRYMDSKWNAGDALSQVIQLRGYAKANITITPYADIYATVKYASYLVQQRATHDVPVTLVCPLDTVNDSEIYIYSAPQISSIGDLSGLKVGFADFSQATRLQSIKLGDNSIYYSNANLNNLTLGSNRLLKVLDVRNCVALGTGDQKTIDLSGCTGIEEVYFDGTMITGVTLPNGGVLRILHLPSTITSLIIRNQPSLTDFTCPSLTSISTLWLENTGSTLDTLTILEALTAGARVRLFGFLWELDQASEISDTFDILDDMRGLDQNGDNMATAQVYGTIHVPNITGDIIAHANARYPDITITYDHVTAVLTYRDNDGTVLGTETITDGGAPAHTPTMIDKEDNRYYYTFLGWGTVQNGSVEAGCMDNLTADTTVYAIYRLDEKVYTVRFYNGSTLMATYENVLYGDSIDFDVTPTYSGPGNAGDYVFTGWNPLCKSVK